MSFQEITKAANAFSVEEKLKLIAMLTESLKSDMKSQSLSEEAHASLALIEHDPTFRFLKDDAEDGYTLQHIKERR